MSEIILGDTTSQVNIVKIIVDDPSTKVAPWIALSTLLATFILFGLILLKPDIAKDGTKDIVIYILGVLTSSITNILGYYFGSSLGSARKDTFNKGVINSGKKGE